MFKIITKNIVQSQFRNFKSNVKFLNRRTFLSQAYYCKEVWEQQRNNDPILKSIKLDELYQELDQRYQKTRQISAVDVDVFANAINDDTYTDELLDLVCKLRLSGETCNTLNSTPHAVIRILEEHNQTDLLLNILDDRLNYGVFLDYYTGNLLFDIFWKRNDYLSGARVASQFMLQEDFEHPLIKSFALLHCYNYLLNPSEWPQLPLPEEPEDEVKIRVKYLRNPYDDDHFDLKDPNKIIGKTIYMITKNNTDDLSRSFQILGLTLYNKPDKALELLQQCAKSNKLCTEIIDLLPDDSEIKNEAKKLPTQSLNIQELLKNNVKSAEQSVAEKDIAEQCNCYINWVDERKKALDEQEQRLLINKRLMNIDETLRKLKEKETRLWFFENEEQIELTIDQGKVSLEESQQKGKVKQEDETYIPPEVTANRSQ